mgnify:CR=1 FL=1
MTVAATQFACTGKEDENIAKAEQVVRAAAEKGAQIILLQELFADLYFCQEQVPKWFSTAQRAPSGSLHSTPSPSPSLSPSSHANGGDESALFASMTSLAKELKVVLPISFFERAGNAFFNSIVVVDANGEFLPGIYRKVQRK